MDSKLIGWDKKEISLLIQTYFDIKSNPSQKDELIGKLSSDLRKYAINLGYEIDERHRNINGITMCLQMIGTLVSGKGLKPTHLQSEVYQIYLNNIEEFNILVAEARKIILKGDVGVLTIGSFEGWLSANDSKTDIDATIRLIKEANNIMRRYRITKKDIMQISSSLELKTVVDKFIGNSVIKIKHRKSLPLMEKALIQLVNYKSATSEVITESQSTDFHSEESARENKSFEDDFKSWLITTKHFKESTINNTLSAIRFINYKAQKSEIVSKEIYYCGTISDLDLAISKIKSSDAFIHIDENQGFRLSNALTLYHDFFLTLQSPSEENHEEASGEVSSNGDIQLNLFENTLVQVREDTSKEAFLSWLQNRKGLSIATCRSYASALNGCEQFSEEHNLGMSFYGNKDYNTIVKNVGTLLSNSDFNKLNNDQHNRFSVAMNHFMEFAKDKVIVPTEFIDTRSVIKPNSEKDKYTKGISKILYGHYKYGFRIESAIEIMRFRQFAEDEGIDLPDSDEMLNKLILNSGFVVEGKVYTIDNTIISELSKKLYSIHDEGINVVFYEPFMDKNSEWFNENHIMSIEILKKLIQDNLSNIRCGKNYLSFDGATTESEAVIAELRRVWEDSPIMSISRMDELLEYIPEENIKRCCYANAAITWSHDDYFLLLDRFIITDEQIAEIKRFADEKCESDGYFSINDIPMEQIAEENYEVSPIAVSSAIYKLALQDKFELNGKILTNGSSSIDIVSLLKKYCANMDECSFDEVAEKVVEITGSSNRRAAFQALYDTMVRTDSNRFVADRHVRFDADAIDDILGSFVSNGYISIKGITTFAMFPVCGQIWNHYLVESYCYKFSKRYHLLFINFNDKNCGIIAEKSLNKSYDDLLAETAANAEIELTEESVGTYLFDNGYISKSKSSNIKTIVANAAQIREGK